MKQNQILENTKKMTDRSLELTQSVIENQKNYVPHPLRLIKLERPLVMLQVPVY